MREKDIFQIKLKPTLFSLKYIELKIFIEMFSLLYTTYKIKLFSITLVSSPHTIIRATECYVWIESQVLTF